MPVQTERPSPDPVPTQTRTRTLWPLAAVVAGLLGAAATFVDSRVGQPRDPDYTISAGDLADLDSAVMRLGGLLGYLAVAALVVFVALWHRRVAQRFAGSVGAVVVLHGLQASAAALTLAYGWKAALGNYGPGATEAGAYDEVGLYAYYILNDFGPFIAWLPALVALGGLAWMAFHERLVSRALGAFALLVFAAGYLAVAATGVPGLPFVAGPAWVVVGLWLVVGRSPITVGAAR